MAGRSPGALRDAQGAPAKLGPVSWLLTFVGISVLVILHELGHFAAAKAVGMRVERFSLFFGPLLVKARRGETEYGIGPIPLGGYVKIAGMNPAEPMAPDEAHRGYYRQAVWKRMVVISAGPAMNVLVAFLILWGVYAFSAQHPAGDRTRIVSVEKGMPAKGVLRSGDVLVAVDGRPVSVRGQHVSFIGQIAEHRCPGPQTEGCTAATPVHFTVKRGSQLVQLWVRPRYNAKLGRPLVGIKSGYVLERESVGEAAGSSLSQMWFVTHTTVSRVTQIFTSTKAREEVHGIVGVSDVASQAFSFSIADACYILALLSLSLAVINLFPFLPLDGGHLFWALAEKIRGKAIPFTVMERASAVGIALVVAVAIIGLSNDISSLSNGSLTLRR
jgi:regulator of sigma E protease